MPSPIIEGISFGITLLMLPIALLGVFLIYLARPYLQRVYNYLFAAGGSSINVDGRPVYRDESCPICLDQVELQTSGTCGHVFCAKCLFEVYDATKLKINCPSCRKPITTMLRVFEPHDPPSAGERIYTDRIKEYNYLYDDNRGILRCLIELPVLWTHIKNALTNPRFFQYLLRNFGRYRVMFLLVLYILSPFDILPESLLGIVGLLDDIFICLIVLAILSQAVMAFVRSQA